MQESNEQTGIESGDALFSLLTADLGYCNCAYTDAVPFLHELLRRVAERSDAVSGDPETFRRLTEEFEAWIFEYASGGVASWIIFGFERAGLLYHGWNVFDLTLTDKGRRVLAALDRFPDPQPGFALSDDDAEDETVSDPPPREERRAPFRFEY